MFLALQFVLLFTGGPSHELLLLVSAKRSFNLSQWCPGSLRRGPRYGFSLLLSISLFINMCLKVWSLISIISYPSFLNLQIVTVCLFYYII